ncbi:TPA: type II toxin-antitoxin system Phd/YefM family antitoxin [Escherichia coli O22:H16]|nr:type II toxin-antitoxin system Phd/YefM family antitoxin [Escherichia coli O22:H16]
MKVTTLSSRELNQDISRAKRAASYGPVFITDRGKAAHVLLSIEEYRQLVQQRRTLIDALAMTDADDVAFEPPRIIVGLNPAEFL